MKKLDDKDINELFNKLLLDGCLENHSRIKKQELIKFIARTTGADEKKLNRIKKDDLTEEFIRGHVYSTEDICTIDAELAIEPISLAIQFDNNQQSSEVFEKSKIEWFSCKGHNHDLYLAVNFKEGLKYIEYVNKHFAELEKYSGEDEFTLKSSVSEDLKEARSTVRDEMEQQGATENTVWRTLKSLRTPQECKVMMRWLIAIRNIRVSGDMPIMIACKIHWFPETMEETFEKIKKGEGVY